MTGPARLRPTEHEVVVDGQPARVVFDLLNAPLAEVNRFLQGYTSGFLAGVERGRQLAGGLCAACHRREVAR